MKKLLFTVLSTFILTYLSAQCSLIEVPLAQRASASTLIVEGAVVAQHAYWNANHTMIYTANEIELYKIFKGSVGTSSIEIITEGGTVGLDRITVEPTLELIVGQVGMFTCTPVVRAKGNLVSRGGLPQFEAYASAQGFVKYNTESATASDPFRTYGDLQTQIYNVCAPAGKQQYRTIKAFDFSSTHRAPDEVLAGPVISGFSPSTVTAGTHTILTINGSNFGTVQASSEVRFKNADDGGATTITPLATQYISWSSTQIKVEVPSGAGTGNFEVFTGVTGTSPSQLTVSYAHLNVEFDPGSGTTAYETDHINDNGSGGYTWQMNTGFNADVNARASFMRAFDTWRCNTGVRWTIGANTSINDAVSDGTNVICFDNTAPLSAGVLGVCYSYWSGCASGPNIIWYVSELDIIFDEGSNIAPQTWQYGPSLPSINQYDFETVAVHELGHGHQLGHVISFGAIMHYAIANGSSNRSLGSSDLAGGNYVQAKSITPNLCGPGAMSSMTCGSPPVASFTSNRTSVCAGGTVSYTDQSTNSPTSWSWSFTGGTPSSSTLQNPVVTYSTPGVYDVSMTATNGQGSDLVTVVGYITVHALPSVGLSVSPLSGTLCAGQSATLSGTGATSYTWTGGVTNGVAFAPPSSQTYTVTGTDANGCTNTAVTSLTVNSAPSLTIVSNPVSGSVCTGNPATLTASGAVSYSWTGGITNGVAFTPPSTATYTVTATGANGCTNTGSRTITVGSCALLTQLASGSCGAVNMTLGQTIIANTVAGATNYEFLFTNVALGFSQSRIKGNSTPTLPLGWITGLQYGNTYSVQVRAFVGGVWQSYGIACNVSLASQVPVPSLTSCAATNMTLTSYLSVTAVVGAQDYEYEVTNAQQPYSLNRLRGSGTSTILLSWFANLQYGRTYNVRVRAKVGGVWSAYSSMCTFTMQATNPPTQLTTSCGATGLTGTSLLYYSAVTGATNYKINIKNSALGYDQTKLKGNSGTSMALTSFTGLLANTTYTVTVASQIGGQWGTFGSPCTITMGATVRLADPENSNSDVVPFATLLFPNPIGDGVNPVLKISGSDARTANVTIVDLTGRVVAAYTRYVEGDDYTTTLDNFPDLVAGMYMMQVQIGDQVQTTKFIAE